MPPPPRLAIFDDQRGRFGPLTRLRAAFDLRTAAHTSRARLEHALGQSAHALYLDPDLAPLYQHHEPHTPINPPVDPTDPTPSNPSPPMRSAAELRRGTHPTPSEHQDTTTLLINARWPAADPQLLQQITALPPGRSLAQNDGSLVAAHLTAAAAQRVIDQKFAATDDAQRLKRDVLLSRPWHILDQLENTLAFDLERFEQRIATDAVVHPSAVIDETLGPVVIDRGASVGPLAVLQGPCYLGPDSHAKPHALLRPNCAIGPACRVAGEISFTIIQGYSNKGHAGFLGHALLGEWINLGADTNASNLKNTYGQIRVRLSHDADPGSEPEDTGRMFMGPILGDHVRTAIGTRINTASVLDLATLFAASRWTPKSTTPFTFHTDQGVEPYAFDRFLTTAKTAMSRRQVEMDPATEARLCTLAGTVT